MNWEKTIERFILFIDILGFKDLVNRVSHEAIFNKMQSLVDTINEVSKKYKGNISLKTEIKPVIFSDSIILITKEGNIEDIIELINSAIYVFQKSIADVLPIKGALSYGVFTSDFEQSLHFGQPLIDAFQLQEELQLYAIVLDNFVEEFLKKNNFDSKDIIKYYTPTKNGKINYFLINPLAGLEDRTQKDDFTKSIEEFYCKVSGKPRIYIDNTLKLIEHINKTLMLV